MRDRPNPKVIESACYEALSAIGVRYKYGTGMLPLDESFYGWVGLNRGVHHDFVRINPNVGIHCIPAMKAIAVSKGEPYQCGRYATYSVPLGELCPDVEQFIFETESEITSQAQRLAATIEKYAIPYMKKFRHVQNANSTFGNESSFPWWFSRALCSGSIFRW
jgi:hypothetical protein